MPIPSPLSDAAATLIAMSTTPPTEGHARSADERTADYLQKDIAKLMRETGGWLWGPTRARYEELRDEWLAAKRRKMTTAA